MNRQYKAHDDLNRTLTRVVGLVGIDPKERPISPHTFRRTINTLRKKMECPKEDRHILLNHKGGDVNLDNYVVLNTEEYVELYDKWNPYKKFRMSILE